MDVKLLSHYMSCDAFFAKTDCVMVLANIVQKNITKLILIIPNGLCLVILYTMKHEIQSMYRTILILIILTILRNHLPDFCPVEYIAKYRLYSVTIAW